MLNPSDIFAVTAAFEHGRRVVTQRRERAARELAEAHAFARRRNQGVSVAGERPMPSLS